MGENNSIKHSQKIVEYTLTKRLYSRHYNNNPEILWCRDDKCSQPSILLEVDDRVVSKRGVATRPLLYHKACAEALNLI